jgi:beta-glucosidase
MVNMKIQGQVEELLSRMTLNEKVGQLNQRMYGWNAYKRVGDDIELTEEFKNEVLKFDGMGALYGFLRADPWSAVTYETGITYDMAAKAVNKLQRYIEENTRLGIPVLMTTDSPHGNMMLDGYLLPSILAMGCTFNPSLIEKSYDVCAKQVKKCGMGATLVSILDMLRDPRWGRSEECFGEDPYLSSKMAKAVVTGCQGNTQDGCFDKDHLAAVAKHFCGQGECQGGINANPANIGKRELREIHLPTMKACCEANVSGCMAAYNEIDGIPCNANKEILIDVLRSEFNFEGIVMADGYAVDGLTILTGDAIKAGALALSSGVDLSLWDYSFTLLEKAVEQGFVSEEDINRSVRRVLSLKYSLGLFDNPFVEEDISNQINYENNDISLKIARESIVLLENKDNLLPLSNNFKKIAIIGPNADNIYNQLGDYTPPIDTENGITILDGIRRIAYDGAIISYAKGCDIRGDGREGFEEAVKIANEADVVILALGTSSKRNFDIITDKTGAVVSYENPTEMDCGEGVDVANLQLGGLQNELANLMFDIEKPVITVLIQGRPNAIEEISRRTTALLCSFYPGPLGGQAIAEIIFGKINPSGHLSVSVPRSSFLLPTYYNYKETGADRSYIDMKRASLYPFGYGLSYTVFEYSDLKVVTEEINAENIENGQSVSITVNVKNAGNIGGFTVAQLYIKDLQATVTRRVKELKGFKKLWLEKNESRVVEFILGKNELGIWDISMKFTVEPGTIRLFCGEDSRASLSTDLII